MNPFRPGKGVRRCYETGALMHRKGCALGYPLNVNVIASRQIVDAALRLSDGMVYQDRTTPGKRGRTRGEDNEVSPALARSAMERPTTMSRLALATKVGNGWLPARWSPQKSTTSTVTRSVRSDAGSITVACLAPQPPHTVTTATARFSGRTPDTRSGPPWCFLYSGSTTGVERWPVCSKTPPARAMGGGFNFVKMENVDRCGWARCPSELQPR